MDDPVRYGKANVQSVVAIKAYDLMHYPGIHREQDRRNITDRQRL